MNAQFSIFPNDRKSSERAPDYTGSVEVGGVEKHDIAIWVKTTKAGKKFWSGQIRPVSQRPQRDPVNQAPTNQPSFEDDLPFG